MDLGEFKPRPFHAYIARPISGKTPEEHERLLRDTSEVQRILRAIQITTYEPGEDPKTTFQEFMPDGLGYLYSRERLAEADFAVFLLSEASWGVGAQNEIATALVLPVIFLCPASADRASQMLISSFSLHWIVSYENHGELEDQLVRLLRAVEGQIVWIRDLRNASLATRNPMGLALRLAELRRKEGWSHEQLGWSLGAPADYVRALEQLPDTVLSPSLEFLHRLAALAGVSIRDLVDPR